MVVDFVALSFLMLLLLPGMARAPPGGWETPISLEADDGEDAYYPKVVADAFGNAIAVWSQNQTIWANRYISGSGWGGPESLSTPDPDSAGLDQDVAMNSSGVAVAVWEEFDGAFFNISSARFDPASGWEQPESIEVLALSQVNPKVAIDSTGNMMVVWTRYSGAAFHVYSAWHDSETPGWQSTELVEDELANWSIVPNIAMSSEGGAIVAWVMEGPSNESVWANRYSPSTGWATEQKISSDFAMSGAPRVAMDAEGNATVVWSAFTFPDDRLWSNTFVQGSGWTGASRVDLSDDDQYIVDLAACAGHPMVVWERYDGLHTNLTWSIRLPGSGWSAPEILATNESPSVFDFVGLSADSQGRAVCIWGEYDLTSWTIWSRWYDAGFGWRAPETVCAGDINSPDVALSDSGDAFVVWMQWQGPRIDVWGSHSAGSIQPMIPELGGLTIHVACAGVLATILIMSSRKRR